MKIVILTYTDDDTELFRKFCIKPDNGSELYEAAQDVVSFINECYLDIKDMGEE